jgi:23S rRNA pseudouridine1911/1915/1917 synthase
MPAFRVAQTDDGRRLDVVLAGRSGLSRARAQRLIAEGGTSVDGRAVARDRIVRAGQQVEYRLEPEESSSLTPESVPYGVVYEDDWLLIVDKPAGVVVHPAPGHEHGTLVQGLLVRGIAGGHEMRPGIVHRLDKDTSGLLIVARTVLAHRRLVAALARREIRRVYVALVVGDLPQDAGVVDVPIGRHARDRTRISVHTTRAHRAVTHFSVRERVPGYTLLDVRLETGRTHQIRVHFAALGFPVAGDVQYGRRSRPAGLERQFLHAAELQLPHPDDGRMLEFAAPLPDDLASFLARTRAGGGSRMGKAGGV